MLQTRLFRRVKKREGSIKFSALIRGGRLLRKLLHNICHPHMVLRKVPFESWVDNGTH